MLQVSIGGADLTSFFSMTACLGATDPYQRDRHVTGVAAQEGSNLAEFLLDQGYHVHGIESLVKPPLMAIKSYLMRHLKDKTAMSGQRHYTRSSRCWLPPSFLPVPRMKLRLPALAGCLAAQVHHRNWRV